MKCKNCGSELDSNSKFCGICGTKIEEIQGQLSSEIDISGIENTNLNIENNVQGNIQTDIQDNVQSNIQTDIQDNVQSNILTDIQDNVQSNIQTDIQNNVSFETIDSDSNQVDYKIESVKSNKKIGIIVAILILICVILGCVYFYFNSTSRIVKGFINSLYDKIDLDSIVDFDLEKDSVLVNGDLSFNSNIPEISVLDGEKLGYRFGIDYPNKKIEFGASLDENGNKVLDGAVYLLNNNMYFALKDVFDGLVNIGDLNFDKYFSIDFSDIDFSKDDLKYVSKAYKDMLIDSLDMGDFSKSKATIEVDGKNVKVTKVSYELTDQKLNKIISKMYDKMSDDSKFIEIMAGMVGVSNDEFKDLLNYAKESEVNILGGSTILFDLYTKGFNNSFVGMDINGVVKIRKNGDVTTISAGVGTQGINIVITKISDNEYNVTVSSNIQGMDFKVDMSISSNKVDDKTTNCSISMNATYNGYSLGFKNASTTTKGSKIADIDVSNAKSQNDFNEEEIKEIREKLFNKLSDSKIYEYINNFIKSLGNTGSEIDYNVVDYGNSFDIIDDSVVDYGDSDLSNNLYSYGLSVELAYTQYQFDKALGNSSGSISPSEVENSVLVNVDGEKINFLVDDYDGVEIVCSGENTIEKGILTLRSCKITGDDNLYDYSAGKISIHE